mmetsp:Transcript_6065/g.16156  ORF Transcript_6065/g.16156 Transcript_6065/m.16156 type:complete len:226 (-) Transcript_6065:426-1103(-)
MRCKPQHRLDSDCGEGSSPTGSLSAVLGCCCTCCCCCTSCLFAWRCCTCCRCTRCCQVCRAPCRCGTAHASAHAAKRELFMPSLAADQATLAASLSSSSGGDLTIPATSGARHASPPMRMRTPTHSSVASFAATLTPALGCGSCPSSLLLLLPLGAVVLLLVPLLPTALPLLLPLTPVPLMLDLSRSTSYTQSRTYARAEGVWRSIRARPQANHTACCAVSKPPS